MKPSAPRPPLDDVLNAYAVEKDTGRRTLERYLKDYPEYAAELVDFSRELSRFVVEDHNPLSAADTALIGKAWMRHVAAAPKPSAKIFVAFSVVELREIAKDLGVPRQVVAAFREGKVAIESVPRKFLTRFAAALKTEVGLLMSALGEQPSPTLARSYKADAKPQAAPPVTFEQLLIDAGVPDEKRAILMAADD